MQSINRIRMKLAMGGLIAVAVALLAVWLAKAAPLIVRRPQPPARPAYESLPRQGHLLLAIMGDTKENTAPLAAIIRDARAKNADAAIILGDFVNRGSSLSLSHVVTEIQAAAGDLPWMAAMGNHEKGFHGDARLYTKFFGPPNYWFRFAKMLFVVIDDVNEDDWQNQLAWLSATLKEQDRGDQVFLFLHRPPKVKDISHSLSTSDSKQLAQALAGHKLMATFASHRHGNELHTFNGAPLYVTGQAGAPQDVDPPQYGYLLLDCGPERCEAIHTVVQAQDSPHVFLDILCYDYPWLLPFTALLLGAAAAVIWRREKIRTH